MRPLSLLIATTAALAIGLLPTHSAAADGQKPISVLIIDGMNNHDWERGTRLIKTILEDSGLFTVDVSTTPTNKDASPEAWAAWRPAFSNYQVVVNNFNGGHRPNDTRWPADVEKAFEDYVTRGGGVVMVHAANNAFLNWTAYNDMIGLGWRTTNFGPSIIIGDDEKVITLPTGQGRNPGHGREHDFQMTVLDPDHPITRGMPKKWMHPWEQLTHGQHGPAKDLHILTYAWSKDVNENEPMDWVRSYGEGRVYTTMLGHLWRGGQDTAMRCVGFQTLLIRGTEWAATGRVTYPIPADFPAAAESRTREIARAKVFLLDAKHLLAVKRRIQSGDTNHAAAVAGLKRQADQALQAGPYSVVTKTITPPSGDKHDYMSLGPYWWPDTNSPNGLPYIRRDGERNPEISSISDHGNLNRVVSAVETLALAHYFTGDETYAAGAAKLLRAWFLDPETRMNPNLQFGQGIPGRTTGRGIGLIETSGLTDVVDAIGLLDGSTAWTEADQRGMQRWFETFLHWMLESPYGRDEAAARNNHGTYYDMQVASFALFIDQPDIAHKILSEAANKRIARQVEPDGRQPHELARTRSWSYSTMNLGGLVALATLGEHVGVDLWHFETADGRSIRRALDYLLPFATGEKTWSHPQIQGRAGSGLTSLLQQAAVHYPDGNYAALLSKVPSRRDASGRNQLLRPQVQASSDTP